MLMSVSSSVNTITVIINTTEDPCKLHARWAASTEPNDRTPESLVQRNENTSPQKPGHECL